MHAGSGDARKILKIDCNLETFPHKMHISACRYYFYILPLDYRYGSLQHFANGKVWVGTDNQAQDAPSNCVHDRIILLKLENCEI